MENEGIESGFLPHLTERFGDAVGEATWTGVEARVTIPVERLYEVLQFARQDPALAMDYPADLTAVDTGERLYLVYRLVSVEKRHSLLLHVDLDPTDPIAPTATEIWLGFDWHEREVYDMFGVRFEGHHNLKRILLPDEWEGFPFRKAYVSVPSGTPLAGPQPMDDVGGAH